MLRRLAWTGMVLLTSVLLGGEPPSTHSQPKSPESASPPLLPVPTPTEPGFPRGVPLPPIRGATPDMPILPAPRPLPSTRGDWLTPLVPELQLERDRLKKEREALANEREKTAWDVKDVEPSESAEEARLRVRLAELHAKLKSFVMEKKAPTPSEPTTTHETVKPPPLPTPTPTHGETPVLPPPGAEVGKPGDPFTLAQALFRAGEYSAALQSYRRIEQEGLALQEKAVVQYMTASCLRKLGKLEDAAALYREVANARDDEVLTDCALWQLNSINWRRDLQKQLEEVRQRREALK